MKSISKSIKRKFTQICVILILTQIFVACNPATWFIAEEIAERGIEDIEKGEEDRLKETK
jgi:hypothetical protein